MCPHSDLDILRSCSAHHARGITTMNKKNALLNIMNNCERWLGAMTNSHAKEALKHLRASRKMTTKNGVETEAWSFRIYILKLGKSNRRAKVLEQLENALAMEDADHE